MTKRRLRDRLCEHFRNIQKGNKEDPVGRHHSDTAHGRAISNVKTHVLSFVTKPSVFRTALKMRLKFEAAWIHRLRTSLPLGLNAMD